MTPKIYVFINGSWGPDVIGYALAEDGTVLNHHISSSEQWLRHDMGVTSDWKHDSYRTHYPDGYDVEYVPLDAVLNSVHTGLRAALKANAAMGIQGES